MLKELVHKYKECKPGIDCPPECDYINCLFKCDDVILNKKYYDETRNVYKTVALKDLDVNTYTLEK